jgi:hypothetical protein
MVRLVSISFVLIGLLVSFRAASAQTALQQFHEMQSALGGKHNISAVRDF